MFAADSSFDRAVSPVISNILMVAVVVILSSVLAVTAFAFLTGTGSPAPQATFAFDYDAQNGTLTVAHENGDQFTEGNTLALAIQVQDADGDSVREQWAGQSGNAAASFPVSAGDTVTVDDSHGSATGDISVGFDFAEGDTVAIVWVNPDSEESFVLRKYEIPTDATGASTPPANLAPTESVQTAIDNASPGDTIRLESGEIYDSDAAITVDKDVTITSQDPSNPATIEVGKPNTIGITVDATGATLDGIRVDGASSIDSDEELVVLNVPDTTVTDSTLVRDGRVSNANLRINGVDDVTVTDLTVKGGPISGQIGAGDTVTISDNTVRRTSAQGMWFYTGSGDVIVATGNDVEDYSGSYGIEFVTGTPDDVNGETTTQAQANSLVCQNTVQGDNTRVDGTDGNPASC